MTGFGRSEGVVNERKVTVELRSLNSKQLDLLVKVPAIYKDREAELRQLVGEQVQRGKVELVIGCEHPQGAQRVRLDRTLLRAYYEELRHAVADIAPDASTDLLAQALRMHEASVTPAERASDEEWAAVLKLVQRAVVEFGRFRTAEGERLATELRGRVEGIASLMDTVEAMDAGRSERTRERLRAKLGELRQEVDEARFEQELVYYLEKLDITEEKVRLRSHCTYFLETMAAEEAQGRKLGFIAQEMGREINTVGSKANDAVMQRSVVHMKDELEKIKEQVLNVL
ncbi:MAG: YicC family protein [Flavobacteriales bacterium]|jgi:uncharacterized protein (TIGR00255 family)|nr:YicC family protein [Flavobacteriales bacterium]